MQPRRVTFFICFLIAATPCYAQESSTEIIYTGRLMGYFRSPAKQSRTQPGCKAETRSSTAALEFEQLRNKKPNAVLVGTGDNFAPELEARMFFEENSAVPRANPLPPSGEYVPGNKELYYWYEPKDAPARWLYYKELAQHEDLEDQLAAGKWDHSHR